MIPTKSPNGCPFGTKDHHSAKLRDAYCCCNEGNKENNNNGNTCCWNRCFWHSPPKSCLAHFSNSFWMMDKIDGGWTAQESKFKDVVYFLKCSNTNSNLLYHAYIFRFCKTISVLQIVQRYLSEDLRRIKRQCLFEMDTNVLHL